MSFRVCFYKVVEWRGGMQKSFLVFFTFCDECLIKRGKIPII
ncbi:hypothetical protein HMPREF1451_00764 [Helicobacter pylori HP260BFii]|uniref:Uncharacterized protein n=1 Tax=Helicobacter pylori GAM260BSi TaxID=1159046 RepID=M3P988_HELPX|nr:hypothetical protein HMPREF1418_01530 [Helicobacter pylori GAM260BSi]EMH68474.1 hypothetical protein HMPREF1451_00764 [Helicobacter pylori HP260BFii]